MSEFYKKLKKKNRQSFVKWCINHNIERDVAIRYLKYDKDNQAITLQEYNEKWQIERRMSGYDWHVLHFMLDAQCLELRITQYLKQIREPHYMDKLPDHYNAAISDLLVPLLWKRKKEEQISTGLPNLDKALENGIPVKHLTEVYTK